MAKRYFLNMRLRKQSIVNIIVHVHCLSHLLHPVRTVKEIEFPNSHSHGMYHCHCVSSNPSLQCTLYRATFIHDLSCIEEFVGLETQLFQGKFHNRACGRFHCPPNSASSHDLHSPVLNFTEASNFPPSSPPFVLLSARHSILLLVTDLLTANN